MTNEYLEVEVKFYLEEISAVRSRIIETGAENRGKAFETNIRFEDENKTLIQKKSLLRLRKDSAAKLTFKQKYPSEDDQFKVRREYEVEVSDFDVMKYILESLGFQKEQIYEKWRETFVSNGTCFCIDTMPYGNFLEIEGEKEDIKNLAGRIGLKWEKRILLNYLGIFEIIKQKLNLGFSDVTFDNFKDIRVDFSEYLHLIEIGQV
ncbi:MAG: class IV adenylate cyclase [Desulfobacterales bacterium]|nr:class IV adenylate cyclase [Desulfobacterales bacterium]